MLQSYRRHDPVIVICQNNEKKAIEIGALNAAAETITGYSSDEMRGQSLENILSKKISESLQDRMEYELGADSVADVLVKTRGFALRNKAGEEYPFKLRIVRC